MRLPTPLLVPLLVLAAPFLPRARAQTSEYTDEAAFLADLAALGFVPLHEGFEDDAVWGHVRTTISGGPHTAPSVHSQGLTWLPNNANSELTTSNGPARTGLWGFYESPHGDWTQNIHDGFGATGDEPLIAIGGWIETNTPFAKISLWLDGVEVDFSGGTTIGTQHAFFGAIDLGGFSHFEYLELEAEPDDWKYIFADDFRFAFGGPGTPYCFCDGSGEPPPCGNAGAPGRGCANGTFASGCGLSATGDPSVASDTLVLRASGSTPGQPGLFFQGNSRLHGGDGFGFGDGLRCAGGGVVRLEVRAADASGAVESTVGIASRAGLAPGDLKRYQWWYRDPRLSPCQSGFNLSNGLEIAWTP